MEHSTESSNQPVSPKNLLDVEDEITLLDYVLVIARNARLIGKVCLTALVVTCVVVLLLPNVYVATARLMPPNEGGGGLASMLGGMGDLAALAGVSTDGGSGDLFVGMLKSRTVSDAIIDRFHLMEVYDQDYRVKMYEKLDKLVTISLGKDNDIISISVEDEDAQQAAAIANAYVEELKKLNVELNLGSAGRQRAFLEERLSLVKRDLTQAEEALRSFQKGNNAIRLDEQAKAVIETIAQLKGQIVSKEVELGAARSFQTEQNPEVKALRQVLAGLYEQLRRLEHSPEGQKVSGDIFIATSSVPDIGLQFARVMREFKVQETLYELLTKQYELAKIEEAKNTSTIQVLDAAVAPDKKSKPKRLLIVLLVVFVAGCGAVLWAFVREFVIRMPADDFHRLNEIKGLLLDALPRRRKS